MFRASLVVLGFGLTACSDSIDLQRLKNDRTVDIPAVAKPSSPEGRSLQVRTADRVCRNETCLNLKLIRVSDRTK